MRRVLRLSAPEAWEGTTLPLESEPHVDRRDREGRKSEFLHLSSFNKKLLGNEQKSQH